MTERQAVTAGIFGLTVLLLGMAAHNPKLWDVKLFEVVLQAVVLTGLLNMVLAFHFTANKQNEIASANTGRAFDAIAAAANSSPAHTDATFAAEQVADAAVEEAERIKSS